MKRFNWKPNPGWRWGVVNNLDRDICAETKERTSVSWIGNLPSLRDLGGSLPLSGPQFPCVKMRRGVDKTNSFLGSRQQFVL